MTPVRRILLFRPVAGAFVWLFAPACSSAPSGQDVGFSGPPLASAVSETGALEVGLRTSITPPSTGLMQAQLVVTERGTGEPVDGLTVAVTPWMPSMTHGSSVVVQVTPQGKGVYLLSDVSLFMPGTWEIRTTFSGPLTDAAEPEIDVE